MAKTPLISKPYFLLIITIFYIATTTNFANSTPIKASSFVKSSCSSTTYPDTCVASLGMFSREIKTDHSNLATTSLVVALSHARSAHRFVARSARLGGLRKREHEAIKDCLEEFDDASDKLAKSVAELKGISGGRFKGEDFLWHMSNLQTWVSAALTDENTCIDGFAGKALDGRVKEAIRAKSLKVVQVTSNALALCNLFAQQKQ